MDYQRAIDEVFEIIELLDETERSKIPKNVIDFFYKNKSEPFVKRLNHNKKLKEQNLSMETVALLSYLTRFFVE